MLQKTEGAYNNGQSTETGNIGHTRHGTKTRTPVGPTFQFGIVICSVYTG